MVLSRSDAVDVVRGRLWPLLQAERERVKRIDRWMRWDHDDPHNPRYATREYREIAKRAQAPWGRRVVTAVTDQLYVEGYRASQATDNATPWRWWQENGMDARQIALHEATVGHGLAYTVVLPGKSWLGDPMPVIRALDRSEMVAVYEDPAWDDWPEYALRARPTKVGDRMGWRFRLIEEGVIHNLIQTESGEKTEYVSQEAHGTPVCPVVRYTNHLDLRGRADGDVEPVIPLLSRIDQTVMDRLVVQRFAAWKVRYIAGMSTPEQLEGESAEQYRERTKLRLAQEDILIAEDPETKFGTLDETPLDGFINAHDADVRALAALTQSPAHELMGQMSNLSAEALAAAEASLTRRVTRVEHPLGEAHEQTFRLAGLVMGDEEAARDFSSEVHWRDMESRSLAQAADALGKLATMLNVPVEVLWEKIPGWTQQDVDAAKAALERGGGLEALMRELAEGQASPEFVQ